MLMLLLGLVSPFLETQLSRWCVASTLLPAFYLGLLVCEQELDVDCKVFAASDLRSCFRDFCEANYPGRILHWYSSIALQAAGDTVCDFCQQQCSILGKCDPVSDLQGESVNLMVAGSPCNPFSQQRTKRFLAIAHSNFFQEKTKTR